MMAQQSTRQVVDTDTAREFMRETLDKVAEQELAAICAEVEEKSRWFRSRLAPERLPELSAASFYALLRRIFSTRRKADGILQQFSFEALRDWTQDLLYGPSPLPVRFQKFVDRLEGLEPSIRYDFASELLHFTDPDRYWLWTRWMWDPRVHTGALPLVTYSSFDLQGDSESEIYMRIGEAVAFVHQVGEAAGFTSIRRSPFGTDVYLSCVYVIYAYTVLRLRMTQEFNRVVPQLPEFSRRLLGVYKMHNEIENEPEPPSQRERRRGENDN